MEQYYILTSVADQRLASLLCAALEDADIPLMMERDSMEMDRRATSTRSTSKPSANIPASAIARDRTVTEANSSVANQSNLPSYRILVPSSKRRRAIQVINTASARYGYTDAVRIVT